MARLRWLLLLLMAACAQGQIAIDPLQPNGVSFDNINSMLTDSTPAFSTGSANELLLAFEEIGTGTGALVKSVTGCSLSWVLVRRANAQSGDAEVWKAFATTKLTNCVVTAAK